MTTTTGRRTGARTAPPTTAGTDPGSTSVVRPEGRVLKNFSHGGHAVPAPDGAADGPVAGRAARAPGRGEDHPVPPGARTLASMLPPAAVRAVAADFANDEDHATTRFGYLFDDLAAHYPRKHLTTRHPADVVAHLTALGVAMAEPTPPPDALESTIPAIYTYWGQFIDHDLTANTDRPDATVGDITDPGLRPVPPDDVVRDLRNLRHPALNLDSLYGDGPTFPGRPSTQARTFYSGVKFRVGTLTGQEGGGIPGVGIPQASDRRRDLRRITGGAGQHAAQIADPRNDENLVVAQLHCAMQRFHNEVVSWVAEHEPERAHDDDELFERARLLVTRHYQWLVVNDYLATVAAPGTADQVALGGNRLLPTSGPVFMPLEFSVAAFRFGHSMVRGRYDHNRNFGSAVDGGPAPVQEFASLDDLFEFTGDGGMRGAPTLPFNWAIEWDRFVHKGDADRRHFARKIDTFLTPPLHQLRNAGNTAGTAPRITAILKDLAVRNLLRGYKLAIPTGQAVARELGLAPLTRTQLVSGGTQPVADALEAGGFVGRTPLWFYVLKEAEVTSDGNFLGEVGSRIVCETIIGQIRRDADSYLNVPGGWTPADGVRLPGGRLVTTIADLLRFAKVR